MNSKKTKNQDLQHDALELTSKDMKKLIKNPLKKKIVFKEDLIESPKRSKSVTPKKILKYDGKYSSTP